MKKVLLIGLISLMGLWVFYWGGLQEGFYAFSWSSLLFAIAVWSYTLSVHSDGKFMFFFKKGLQAVAVYAVLQSLGLAIFLQCYPDFCAGLIQTRMDKITQSPAFLACAPEEQAVILQTIQQNLSLIFRPNMLILMVFLLHLFLGLVNSLVAAWMIKNFLSKKLAN